MKEIIKMIVVLSCICGLSGLTLATLKDATATRIEEQKLTFVQGPALATVFPDADTNPVAERKSFDLPGGESITVFPARKGGQLVGVAFESFGRGYGGDLGIMIGFTFEPETVAGVGVTILKETPGVGTRVAKHGFTGQFVGHSLEKLTLRSQGGDIDGVTGATISTGAAMEAVGKALTIYEALKDQFKTEFGERT